MMVFVGEFAPSAHKAKRKGFFKKNFDGTNPVEREPFPRENANACGSVQNPTMPTETDSLIGTFTTTLNHEKGIERSTFNTIIPSFVL